MADVVEIIEAGDLESLISSGEEVVIRFTASWCAPCRQLAPYMDKAAEQRPETNFVYVDIDKAPWAVVDYGVMSVPTVFLYRDGRYVKNIVGRTVIQILSELNS